MAAPRQEPLLVPRQSTSCRVVRVYSHVLLRKVTSPGLGSTVRQPKRGHYLDLRLLERAPYGREVNVDTRAAFEHDLPTHAEVKLVERQFRATVPERAHDAAPVGVSTVDGRLDQARRGHRASGSTRIGVRSSVEHPDCDELAGSFSVGGDRASQI